MRIVAGSALALASVLVAAAPSAGVGPRARADLVVSRERLRDSINIRTRDAQAGDCTLFEGCLGGTGRRRTLEFDTYVVNAGTDDLRLGNPADHPELYEYSRCHGHYHLKNSFVYAVSHGGTDTIATFDAATGVVSYRNTNASGGVDGAFSLGPQAPNARPIAGDWERLGPTLPGVYDPASGTFTLASQGSRPPTTFVYRPAPGATIPIAGDWDGDGRDTVGLYDPSSTTFWLKKKNSKNKKADVVAFDPGPGEWQPISGDWDGDDVDTIGLYDRATGRFALRNANTAGSADVSFVFGQPNGVAVSGDWNQDGIDTIGIVDEAGTFRLRNENAEGEPDLVCTIDGGASGTLTPLAGDWDYNVGDVLVPGHKEAFCWLDTQRVTGSRTMQFLDCNTNQGLTAGWCDIYIRNTDCQWIDITGLAPGTYQLAVTVNAGGLIPEADLTNNTAAVKVRIPPRKRLAAAPKVDVVAPKAGVDAVVGQPVTIRWRLGRARDVTRQEIWLADVSDDHPSKVMLIDGNVDPSARSYVWTPTEEFRLSAAQILVRAQNDDGFVGTDARGAGSFAIRAQ